jgi:hypothetical protein
MKNSAVIIEYQSGIVVLSFQKPVPPNIGSLQKYFYINNSVDLFPFKGLRAPFGTGFLVVITSDNFFLLAITLLTRW